MVHGFTVLAISPPSFLRRFRADRSMLIYDPSLGTGQGRVISEDAAVRALAGYELLFRRMQRLVDISAKIFIPAVFLTFFVMAVVGPTIGLYALESSIAIMAGMIALANFRLWRFRKEVWKSLERAVEVERMSPEDRIRHGYRMSWPGRIQLMGMLLVLGPIYLFGHLGSHSDIYSAIGISAASGRMYHKLFIAIICLLALTFLAFHGIKQLRRK